MDESWKDIDGTGTMHEKSKRLMLYFLEFTGSLKFSVFFLIDPESC